MPGAFEDLHHHLDDFGVHRRRFRADGLRADLKELPVAALLRTLAAEHGADVVELLHARDAGPGGARYRRGSPTAVFSGRSVSEVSSRSSKVYISLVTMSVSSPTPRANSCVSSRMGVRISW